ncbi:JmjC domain-containing protein E like [Verticillium longisporum]|uniref:JmjC domain-containing protein E like n=1 Tax=Verticillium longisporum TaxID=100787 RepID=A0A8I2ZE49_VERLO|nr:JmjC domain-containing protein E like [Verticillium longisporum]
MGIPSIKEPAVPYGSIVVVSGASGFIGSHIVDQVLAAGYKVRGTTRNLQRSAWMSDFFAKQYGTEKFELVQVPDMDVDGAFDDAVAGASGFIHVANDMTGVADPKVAIPRAVDGALNALKASAKEPRMKRFVFTSSSFAVTLPKPGKRFSVTADTFNDEAVERAWQPDPDGASVYACSKVEAERAIAKWVEENNPSLTVNTIQPNANIGPVLSAAHQGYPTTAGFIIDEFMKRQPTPQLTDMGALPEDNIADLITTYNELNSNRIEELADEPSALEFMRYVARNTPFVVRNAATSWEAYKRWDKDFLLKTLEDQSVNVAVTPHGNADAPTPLPNGILSLSKPHEEPQRFDTFLNTIIAQTAEDLSSSRPTAVSPEVLYAQTQNSNLHTEYAPLFHLDHLPRSLPFARIALDQPQPDALNLWIGNARATTALHKDNYENLYVQLRGRKRFALLPPHCHPCVNERPLRSATYRRRGAGAEADNNNDGILVLEPDGDGTEDVPFATWDPDRPDANATPYSHLARPMIVVLEPGDMLYLPAMWYHKVSQFCTPEDEGFVLAVNYWYDMDFSGPLYPLSSFVRNSALKAQAEAERHESVGQRGIPR